LRKFESDRSKDLLQLIHTDICETFPILSQESHKCFITFINDFSRYAYNFFIH